MSSAAALESKAKLEEARKRDRKKLQEHREKVRQELTVRRLKAEQKVRDWEEWQETFYTCGPTRLALASGVTSTAIHQQTTFIKLNEQEQKKQSETKRVLDSGAPSEVVRVVDLQDRQGYWTLSEALSEALGGWLPECPTVSADANAWSTALALAFLRRFPESFAFLAVPHERGLPWVRPAWILKAAQETLPPYRRPTEAIPEACSVTLPAVPVHEERTDKAKTSVHPKVTNNERFNAHQMGLKAEFLLLTRGAAKGRLLSPLRAQWESACGVAEERARVKEASSLLALAKLAPKRERQAPVRAQETKQRGPTEARAAEEGEAQARAHQRHAEDEELGEGAYDMAARELEAAQLNAVAAATAYDTCLAELKERVASSAAVWRGARLNATRTAAFEQVTEMLAMHRAPRIGYTDWRCKVVHGMQTVTVKLVQAIVRWRAALTAVGRPSDIPFIWRNNNVLLTALHGLDFLADCAEIVEWYGCEFKFRMNPFSRACTVDERPETPPSEKMTVLVDGEMVEVFNERLVLRQAELKLKLGKWKNVMENAPKWWPEQGNASHQERIRFAEKNLIEERHRCTRYR